MKKLEVGDVFELKKGMEAYISIPERFVFGNLPYSMKEHVHNVEVGEVLDVAYDESDEDLVFCATEDILEAAEMSAVKLSKKDVEKLVKKSIRTKKNLPTAFNTGTFLGNYVVEEAASDGGSRGGGMSGHDDYPDGWKITARQLDKKGKYSKNGRVVSFYQSGCFNATNENVPVLRKMKMGFR